MGVYAGPEINETGLVLCLDAGNIKSYNPNTPSVELITNGTFVSDIVGWTTSNSTNTWSSGKMQITRTAGEGTSSYQVISTVPGVTYAISAEVNSSGSRGDLYVTDGTGWGGTTLFTVSGTYLSTLTLRGTFTATSNTTSIGFRVDVNDTSITVDDVSVSSIFWNDISGRGNNGTLTGGPTYSSGNLGSLSFDATNDYITINDSNSLDLTTALTLSLWFNRGDILTLPPGDQHNLFIKGNSNISNFDIINYCITLSDGVAYRWADDNGGCRFSPPSQILFDNQWYNLVITHVSGSTPIPYLNGVIQTNWTATFGSTSNPLTSNSFKATIGGDVERSGTAENAATFNGKIALIQAYNRALTTAEVTQNFYAFRGRFGLY